MLTSTPTTIPQPVLYPVDMLRRHDLCERCFQAEGDGNITGLATISDQRITPPGRPIRACSACYRALIAGEQPVLPTGEALATTWRTLARYHANGTIGTTTLVASMETLAPGMDIGEAAVWVDELERALLTVQRLESGDLAWWDVVPEASGSEEERDAVALWDASTRVELALRELTGGAR